MKKHIDHVYARIHPEPNTGCWLWAGAHDRRLGYGTVRFPGGGIHNKVQNVHRVVYMLERGPIPKGFDLDHLCRNPACVNPDHLEIVTRSQNLMRGIGPAKSSRRMAGNQLWKLRRKKT